jgi:NTE family protein
MKSGVTSQVAKVLSFAVRSLRRFASNRPSPPTQNQDHLWRPRVGLALGGGFARGVAHVGVLKVLVENKIPIHALAGTSAGSLAAAAFASGCSIDELIEMARALRWNRVGRWTFSRLGFATNERMESLLREWLHCLTFEELKLPLAVMAADITTGEAVTYREGSLIEPLRASCCFPGLFVPVRYNGRLLVDGVIAGSVPVATLKAMDMDVVVAVHIKSDGHCAQPTNLIQIVSESFQIIQDRNQSNWRDQCHLVIEPRVQGIRWDEFEQADEVIAAGEAAAREALPALRRLVEPCTVPALGALLRSTPPTPLQLKPSVRLGLDKAPAATGRTF